jgi:archaellum component FlaC
MSSAVSWELIVIIVAFTVSQLWVAWQAWGASTRVETELRDAIAESRDFLQVVDATRQLPSTPPVQRAVLSVFRLSWFRKSPISIEEASDTVDFYLGANMQSARSAVTTLPILGLLATFLGMGIALWSSASAQGELSRTLSSTDAPVAQTAPAPAAAPSNFETDIGTLRAQLKQEMDHSTEGLRKFVEQQQRSLAGMGIAVTASILGILLSLLIQHRIRRFESTRLALVDVAAQLSVAVASIAQTKSADIENLSSDELLKRLIAQLEQFMLRVDSTEKAASITADSSGQMLLQVNRLVSEVATLASQSRATDAAAREMLDSASRAVVALTPTAEAARRILDDLGDNVTELQEHISQQVGLLHQSFRTAKDSVAQIESATSQTVGATNDLRATVSEFREVRSTFETKSTDVTGRVDKLIDNHRNINDPIATRMTEVTAQMQKVERRMGSIEKIANDSNLSPT